MKETATPDTTLATSTEGGLDEQAAQSVNELDALPGAASSHPVRTAATLPLISFDTIVSNPLPPAAWCVEPLIGDGSRVVVYGEWGSFKSWGLLSLGLHIAAGPPWLGQYPIHRPRRVLYIDEEMSPRLLRRRVKRLAAGMDPQSASLPFRALSRRGLRLDADGVKALLADLVQSGFDPEVVIVETFRRVLVGDENTAKDVAEFWRAVEPITRAGKTLIVSHHMKKPQSRSRGAVRHRASGSTDVMSAADDALAFERAGKEGFTVEPVKCRESEEAPPFAVSLAEPQGPDGPVVLRHEGSPADFRGLAGKASQAEALILGALRAAPNGTLGTGSLWGILSAQGVKKRTMERALERLTSSSGVLSPEDGVYQLPETTPQGFRHPPSPVRDSVGGDDVPSSSPDTEHRPSAKPFSAFGGGGTPSDPFALFDTPCAPVPPSELADAA